MSNADSSAFEHQFQNHLNINIDAPRGTVMQMGGSNSTRNLDVRNLTVMAKGHRKNTSSIPMGMTGVGGGTQTFIDDGTSYGGS